MAIKTYKEETRICIPVICSKCSRRDITGGIFSWAGKERCWAPNCQKVKTMSEVETNYKEVKG